MVDPTINDHSSLLDPLSFHHLCFANANNQDVRFPHLRVLKIFQLFLVLIQVVTILVPIRFIICSKGHNDLFIQEQEDVKTKGYKEYLKFKKRVT